MMSKHKNMVLLVAFAMLAALFVAREQSRATTEPYDAVASYTASSYGEEAVTEDPFYSYWTYERELDYTMPYQWRAALLEQQSYKDWKRQKYEEYAAYAHRIGVTGFTDREAYWADVVQKDRRYLLAWIAKNYSLVAIEQPAETATAK